MTMNFKIHQNDIIRKGFQVSLSALISAITILVSFKITKKSQSFKATRMTDFVCNFMKVSIIFVVTSGNNKCAIQFYHTEHFMFDIFFHI